MPNPTPPTTLTPRQANALKRIADGQQIEVETWCALMHFGLADSEIGDDGETHDVLTVAGYRALRQIEVKP